MNDRIYPLQLAATMIVEDKLAASIDQTGTIGRSMPPKSSPSLETKSSVHVPQRVT
jgi:hypothetical protein